VSPSVPINAPRPKASSRVRLWRAMRQLRRFDLRELQAVTETTEDTARSLVKALRRTGYIARRGQLLMLVRDTGPKPPRLCTAIQSAKRRLVGAEDRNTGVRYGIGNGPTPPPRLRPSKPGLNDRGQLRAARALLGLSRSQLARRARISRQSVGRLELGDGAFLKRRGIILRLERIFRTAKIEFLEGDGWSGVKLWFDVTKKSSRPRRGTRQATTQEKIDLMKRFQAYAEREISLGRIPAAKRFFQTLNVPFAASTRSINHWYHLYRRAGEQGLGGAERRGRPSVFERHPELAAEAISVLRAKRTISVNRLRAELRQRLPSIDVGTRAVQRYVAKLRHQRIVDPLAKAKNRYLR